MAGFTFSESKGTGTDGASFSTTINLPAGGAERTLMAAVMARSLTADTHAIDNVTADGDVVDILYESIAITDSGTNRMVVVQFSAADFDDPTDTNIPFVITWLGPKLRHYLVAGGTSDAIELTPFDTNNGERTPNGSTAAFTIDVPIDIPEGGFALIFGVGAVNGAPTGALFTTVSNIGQTYNGGLSGEALSFLGGSSNDMDAESQRAISATAQNAAGIFGIGIWAGSFEPAGVDGVLAAAGTGALSATGSVLADGVFAASGSSTVTWKEDGEWVSAGIAAATFVGNVLVDAVFVSAGIGTAAFGPSDLDAAFSMTGVADAVFSSLIPVDGALTVEGDSDAAWVGEVITRWSSEMSITNVWTSEDGVV